MFCTIYLITQKIIWYEFFFFVPVRIKKCILCFSNNS